MATEQPIPTERQVGANVGWRPARRPHRAALRGGRVLLRPIDADADAEMLYAESHPPLADPGLWTYLPNGPYRDPAELRGALRVAEASEDPLFFTLARLPGEEPAGVASYLRITPDHGVIEIGHIWFGASLRRTTAATEAIYLLAAHAFDELGYRRLEWKCDSLNRGSRRAAQRFGFRFEGVFRNHMVVKGRNRDTAWFAITDDEWPAVRAGFEAWLDDGNLDATGEQQRGLGELIAGARASRRDERRAPSRS
jgi:RimJ/RimL family protein N-acetyltransferase